MIYKIKDTVAPEDYGIPEIKRVVVPVARLDGYTYMYVPDDATEGITAPEATSEEIKEVKRASVACKRENDKVVQKIRERYSIEDELKFLRLGNKHPDFDEYNQYCEECVAQGKARKQKFGL